VVEQRQANADRRLRALVDPLPLPARDKAELINIAWAPLDVAVRQAGGWLPPNSALETIIQEAMTSGEIGVRLEQGRYPYVAKPDEVSHLRLNFDAGTVTCEGGRIGPPGVVHLIIRDVISPEDDGDGEPGAPFQTVMTFIEEPIFPVTINVADLHRYCTQLTSAAASAPRAFAATGRPSKAYWRTLNFEACRWLDEYGVPDRRAPAPLVAHLRAFAAKTLDAHPDDKGLRELANDAIEFWRRHVDAPR
jgi:hypothetical protein